MTKKVLRQSEARGVRKLDLLSRKRKENERKSTEKVTYGGKK